MQKHKTTHNMETRSKHDPVITVKAHLCTKRRPWRSPSAWLCIARGHAMLKITSAHAFRNAQGTTASTLSKIISAYYSIIYAVFKISDFPKVMVEGLQNNYICILWSKTWLEKQNTNTFCFVSHLSFIVHLIHHHLLLLPLYSIAMPLMASSPIPCLV